MSRLRRSFSRPFLIAASCAIAASVLGCRGRTTYPRAPVILISIDTLRADHLPAYGYRDVATPALDDLARDSIRFESAYSHVPLTLPSHATVMTGLLPPENGVRDNTGYSLSASSPTIAETLRGAGYSTGGVVSSVVLANGSGIARGFDFYDDSIEATEPGVSLGSVQRAGGKSEAIAESWITAHGAAPIFCFLHLYEPHTPYVPPEPFASTYRKHPYDGEIAAADAIVGTFIGFLKQKGLYDRAIVVVMSDHGEGLGQHGEDEHGILLYREALRVPLFLKLPGRERAGSVVTAPVGLVDVSPTLLELLALPPRASSGESLLSERPSADERAIYSETLFPRYHFGWSDLASLESAGFQYIHGPDPELYDTRTDAEERHNLAGSLPPAFRKLRLALLAIPRPRQAPGASDPEAVRKLAALGYIGAASPSEGATDLPDPKLHLGEIRDLKTALRLYQDGEFPQALAAFSALLGKNPAMGDAWGALAEAQHKLGLNEEAIASLRRQDQLAPGSPHVLLSFANEYLETDRLPEAVQYAKRALAIRDLPDAHELLARIYLASGDLPSAEAEARRVLEGHSGRVMPMVVLAQIARQRGDLAGALRLLDEALASIRASGGMEMSNVHFLRGDVLARAGRNSDARAEFEREIELFPNNTSAWASAAILDASDGRREEGLTSLERRAAGSRTPRGYRAAAQTFRILGDSRRAAAFEKLLRGSLVARNRP